MARSYLEQNAYWVPAADGVLGLGQILVEDSGVPRLDGFHASAVKCLNALVDWALSWEHQRELSDTRMTNWANWRR